MLEFGVSYDVLRLPVGWTANSKKPARDLAVQLRVGGRYTALDVDVSFPDIGNRSRSEGWVDPMIGARFLVPFSQDWSFVINGSIGGFGAASQLALPAGGTFSRDFTIGQFPSSLQFGYLAIGDDYTKGSGADRFVWDTVLQGPVIHWAIRF
ncbi:MAG: hypothetical protein SGJ09_13730 [Phycisphaerae bacterium]|nr:hypothetical protein [Phycisphaerae bacterium]